MRTVLLTRQAVTVAAVAALGVVSAPAMASVTPARRAALHVAQDRAALPAGQQYACPPEPAGYATCMAIVKTASRISLAALAGAAVKPPGFHPTDLRRAYKLTTTAPTNGRGRVVAIVDAYSDPHAEADLKVYRSFFHLPPCSRASGCLHIFNEHGNSGPLPRPGRRWALEESLDLDMVSAICPLCHITLVEATNPSLVNLGIAENTAIARGAKYVSNSWAGGEYSQEGRLAHYFNHPGHVISFASGDAGFGPAFPASLQFVTSVGGTSLRHASNSRGWTESVWGTSGDRHGGTGSGCSAFEAKPSWQRQDIGYSHPCLDRTENDASAVGNPDTGVSIYDSYQAPLGPGFYRVGGTSAATPIITSIYALAGAPVRNTYPAQYPYLKQSHLFDVTSGTNGTCGVASYLCHGIRGFDGPTGIGTPDGTGAFSIRVVTRVTLIDPGTQRRGTGGAFSLKITGLDTRKVSSLRYSAKGLPHGWSVKAIAHSTDATISGTLPSSPGTFHVTVTAKDGSATGTTHFAIVVS